MVFYDLIAKRRSHRLYAEGELDAEQVQAILRAALKSPTSRNNRKWQFVVVDDKVRGGGIQSFVMKLDSLGYLDAVLATNLRVNDSG